MSLDDQLAEFRRLMRHAREGGRIGAEMNDLRRTLRRAYNRLTREEVAWILGCLNSVTSDADARGFLATLLAYTHSLPNPLFDPLIRTAVYEKDPSINRYFIEPAVRAFGFRRVAERLLRYLDEGSDFEKAGAVNASYWAHAGSEEHVAQELRQRIRDRYLTVFVSNDSVQVRRCIISQLKADPAAYSPAIRNLLPVAIDIARAHPDDYIRHRVEVQLGNESLLRPLPERHEGDQ